MFPCTFNFPKGGTLTNGLVNRAANEALSLCRAERERERERERLNVENPMLSLSAVLKCSGQNCLPFDSDGDCRPFAVSL
jgi:hypothetical protein